MKVRKPLIIIAILGFLLFFGTCIYFGGEFAKVNPPMKFYNCPDSVKNLFKSLKNFSKKHQNIIFHVTDKTGDKDIGYTYYANFDIKDSTNNYEYNLEFENISSNNIQIGIIGAFDWKHKLGGYDIGVKGVPNLLKQFNDKILIPLNKEQHITWTITTSYKSDRY